MKCHQRLAQAISEMTVAASCMDTQDGMSSNGSSSSSTSSSLRYANEQLKELKAAEIQSSNYLHDFHVLRHAARIMMVGMTWLNTNGKDTIQISKLAQNALEPLRRAQTLNEYQLWISILETLSANNAEHRNVAIRVLQCHFGNKIGLSFMKNSQQPVKKKRKTVVYE